MEPFVLVYFDSHSCVQVLECVRFNKITFIFAAHLSPTKLKKISLNSCAWMIFNLQQKIITLVSHVHKNNYNYKHFFWVQL